ncbi:hypothetical protein [Streptomyces sp. NPDC048349]|uniref:hypothetical protein n=1 Tax=Streptomyces sp. NPDC048349 TaxID=3155486 RepID=UPI003439EFA8
MALSDSSPARTPSGQADGEAMSFRWNGRPTGGHGPTRSEGWWPVPEFFVNRVAALTETGSLVLASGRGSQLPADAGGAAHALWRS